MYRSRLWDTMKYLGIGISKLFSYHLTMTFGSVQGINLGFSPLCSIILIHHSTTSIKYLKLNPLHYALHYIRGSGVVEFFSFFILCHLKDFLRFDPWNDIISE